MNRLKLLKNKIGDVVEKRPVLYAIVFWIVVAIGITIIMTTVYNCKQRLSKIEDPPTIESIQDEVRHLRFENASLIRINAELIIINLNNARRLERIMKSFSGLVDEIKVQKFLMEEDLKDNEKEETEED